MNKYLKYIAHFLINNKDNVKIWSKSYAHFYFKVHCTGIFVLFIAIIAI